MNNAEKNIWVDEVMNSLNGMQRAAVPANMYDGVMQRIRQGHNGGDIRRLLPRIAAAAILLLAVNIASVYHATHKATTVSAGDRQNVSQVIDEQLTDLESNY